MPPKPLSELAAVACIKNIRHIDSFGDYLPYESVRRILLRVENAHQLRQIELNSPQLDGHTAEVWLKIIERDFPMEYKAVAYKPSDPTSWHKVWKKYKKQHDDALAESEAKLKEALQGLQANKQKNTSMIIENKYLPRIPKKKRFMGPKDGSSSTLRFSAGSRTKTNNGASVMRKVRRQVSEIARIHGSLSRPVATPKAGPSSVRSSQVGKAPQSMINDRIRAAQPAFRTAAQVMEPSAAVQDYEQRATFLSDSDDDGGGSGGEVDLPSSRAARPKAGRITAPSRQRRSPPYDDRRRPPSDYASASSPPSTTIKKKGKGLLSNSYRPTRVVRTIDAQEGQIQRRRTENPSRDDDFSRSELNRPPQTVSARSTALPPAPAPPSSPPPVSHESEYQSGPSRKRKPVNVFMRPNKRVV